MPTDYDLLLGDLYAGVAEPARLHAFMGRLGALTGSHQTALVRHHDGVTQDALGTLALDPALLRTLRDDFTAGDIPWFANTATRTHTGAVLNGDEAVSKRELKRSRYYADFLKPVDIAHSVALCGPVTPKHAMFLTPCRSERAGPYGTQYMRLFERLAPHWVNACSLMLRFEQVGASAAGAHAQERRGLFLLDHAMCWVGGNAVAERMVEMGWWRGKRGSPLASTAVTTRTIWEAVQRQARARQVSAVVIPVHDARGSLVAFATLQRYGAGIVGADVPDWALFVRPLRPVDDAGLLSALRQLFGLTAGEALLAQALHRHGELGQAANALQITAGSARTRMQTVFGKTACHRQSDLLRMLDALAETVV